MQGIVRKKIVICLFAVALCILLLFHHRSLGKLPDLIRKVPNVSPISQPPEATASTSPVFIPDHEILEQMNRDELHSLQKSYMDNLQIHCPKKTIYGGVGNGWYTCDLHRDNIPKSCDTYLVTNAASIQGQSFFNEIKTDYGCEKHFILNNNTESALADIIEKTRKDGGYRAIYFMAVSTNGNEETVIAWMLRKTLLKEVQQLFVTFHGIDSQSGKQRLKQHLTTLKALYYEGFRSFHYLLNPVRYYNFDQRKWTTMGRYTLYMMRDLPTFPPVVLPSEMDINQMSLTKMGQLYHSYMHSSQEFCKDVVRVGQAGDGGWNMCNDTEYRPSQPCLVYSFGINNDWGFDDHISSNYGCEVHAFDPSMGVSDHKRSNKIFFHNLGLSNKNGVMNGNWKCMNLQTIIHTLGHEERIIDIVKMDIEGSEWPAMDSFIPSGILKNIRQLYFEFHSSIKPTNEYGKRLANLQKLYNNGFRLFWGHPNQVQVNLGYYEGRQKTACYEEYYINVKLKRSV